MIGVATYSAWAEVYMQRFSPTNLAELLKLRGITPYAIAKQIGVSNTWVQRLLKGEIKRPTDEYLAKLSRALDVPPIALFDSGVGTQSDTSRERITDEIVALIPHHQLPALAAQIRVWADIPDEEKQRYTEIGKILAGKVRVMGRVNEASESYKTEE